MATGSRALLVDGNNLLSRATFASANGRVEMSHDGQNTAALVLFVNMLSKYVRQVAPTHVAVYWDSGHAFRDALYPAYKANRNPHPEHGAEDAPPYALAKEFLTWSGIPHAVAPGWEADDLIAVVTRGFDGEVVIVSGDRDLLQLVDAGRVTQIRPPDDDPWDWDRVEAEFGYTPAVMPYVKALVGDTGDGVPGVRGIGPKKATKVLDEAGWDWEATLTLLGPEKAAEARLQRQLVDLRYLDYATAGSGLLEGRERVRAWAPTTPADMLWAPLSDFLDRWALQTFRSRIEDGSLWRPTIAYDVPFEGV